MGYKATLDPPPPYNVAINVDTEVPSAPPLTTTVETVKHANQASISPSDGAVKRPLPPVPPVPYAVHAKSEKAQEKLPEKMPASPSRNTAMNSGGGSTSGGSLGAVSAETAGTSSTLTRTYNLEAMKASLNQFEIARSRLTMLEFLGDGHFGNVCKGQLSMGQSAVTVAIKALKDVGVSELDAKLQEAFLKEVCVAVEFEHPNVVRLIGVSTLEQPMLMVMEYMQNGDLRKYLAEHLDTEPRMLLRMAMQVACGLAYLGNHKFVHRDLAARNCMVAADLTVKIGDFGLARDVYDSDYYQQAGARAMPIKWMAPEALLRARYTVAGDVWSFGVVLYEIFSYGEMPYAGLANGAIVEHLRAGNRLPRPQACPTSVYDVMLACMTWDSERRPKPEEIITRLSAVDVSEPYYTM
eukprot:Colp12_sorted_trinity150504_noHs@21578